MKGTGLFGNRGFAGKAYLQPHSARGASQLTKQPHVSEDLTAVLVGISFSKERCLVREQGETGSEIGCGEGQGFGMGWGWRRER